MRGLGRRIYAAILSFWAGVIPPDYATNEARVANRARLEAKLSLGLCTWNRDDLLAAFAANGVPGGPINRVDQVFEDAQVQARGMLEHHLSPGGTTIPLTRFPARLSETPATIRNTPPALGADTLHILGSMLGLNETDLAHLVQTGAIAPPNPQERCQRDLASIQPEAG